MPADDHEAGFSSTVTVLAALVESVPPERLDDPTPCREMSVGDLLHHIDILSTAFTAAAAKTAPPVAGPPPTPDAALLGPDWRTRIPEQLRELAAAWKHASAWQGMTRIAGLELPAAFAGRAALDEVLVHGWDLAAATGRPYPSDEPEMGKAVELVFDWVSEVVRRPPPGGPRLFDPPVPAGEDATRFESLIALTGRPPSWRPPGTAHD